MHRSILTLMGPTATGKTALAMALSDQKPIKIISVDAMMVYRNMDVGTAKPTAEECVRYPHALIDLIAPDQSYSVSSFVHDALLAIEKAWQGGLLPVLVGGSMMYFHALIHGLSDLPSGDAAIRTALAQEAEQNGWPSLWKKLEKVDPIASSKIKPNDAQRIQRALEVYQLTGKSIVSFWGKNKSVLPEDAKLYQYALWPKERAWMYARIHQRFDQMLAQGWEEETKYLLDTYGKVPALRAVGYRQMVEYLEGKCSRSQMIEEGKKATRRFAKRQCTWIRNWPDVRCLLVADDMRKDAPRNHGVSSSMSKGQSLDKMTPLEVILKDLDGDGVSE